MNENEDKELDRLLDGLPAPEAPAWFKQKTLNRLRAEQSKRSRWGFWWASFQNPRLVSLGAVAASLAVAAVLFFGEGSNPVAPPAQVSLDTALEAFASYTEENADWGGDPFL